MRKWQWLWLLSILVAMAMMCGSISPAACASLEDADRMIREAQSLWNGNYAGAEDRLRQALSIKEALLGRDAIAVADVLNLRGRNAYNWGSFQGQLEPLRLAETQFRRDLAINQAARPESVPAARSLGDLAATLRELCRLEEASDIVRQSIALRRRILAPGHAWIASGLDNLSKIEELRGNQAEAIQAMEDAVTILRDATGQTVPTLRESIVRLGCLRNMRRAEPCWPKRCGAPTS